MSSRWKLLFHSAIRGCLRGNLYLTLPIAIVGCGLAEPGFDTLHPRQTTDCSHHIDARLTVSAVARWERMTLVHSSFLWAQVRR